MRNMARGYHLTEAEQRQHAEALRAPIRRLQCECCGHWTSGRQWLKEIGYGICPECADMWAQRGDRDMRAAFGVRGVHYDLAPEAEALDYLRGLILNGLEFADALNRATQIYLIDAEELTRAYDAQY